MLITYEFLESKSACSKGIKFVKKNIPDCTELTEFIKLLTDEHLNWQNWLISRLLSKDDCVRYAIYAAEKVLPIFTDKYPNDERPAKAIQAAKDYLKNHNADAADAVVTAADYEAAAANAYAAAYDAAAANAAAAANVVIADAAYEAAVAAYYADNAAAANADAAFYAIAASDAAFYAIAIADAAYYAAADAAYAALYAAAAEGADACKKDIINYGIELIKMQELKDGNNL